MNFNWNFFATVIFVVLAIAVVAFLIGLGTMGGAAAPEENGGAEVNSDLNR